jgi:hypothetical protein
VHLLAALEALGEATATEVAELTGRTRPSVYPHLQDMARAGIIGTGQRTAGGRPATTFRFLPDVMASIVDTARGRGLREGAAVSAGALHDASLRCRRWGRVAEGTRIDLARNPEAITSVRITWLDDALRARLNALLRKVDTVLRAGCARREGRRTCVLLYHFPDLTLGEARTAIKARRTPPRKKPRT